MSNTCYIFAPLFCFHCLSQSATNFTFISEIYVSLLLQKVFTQTEQKKLLLKIVKHTLEEVFSDGLRGDVQL